MIIYPATRYVLSGMEHDDVMDEEGYKKTRKKGIIQTFGTGIMFFIFFLLLNIFREGSIDYISIIMVPILFTIFFGIFTMVSLKKSYNKNKDLDN